MIEKHASDPALSAEAVGRALGVSARQVHRLLEETAKTFYEHVTERRLMRAHALLADSSLGRAKIAEIAMRAASSTSLISTGYSAHDSGDTPTGARTAATRSVGLPVLCSTNGHFAARG